MNSMSPKQGAKGVLKKIKSRRAVPLSSRELKESVTTIGYKTSHVLPAIRLKVSYQELKERVGGKAAGLIEMSKLKVPVPPAFNISTAVCRYFLSTGQLPEVVLSQMKVALSGLEASLKKNFGKAQDPLLISVRSGARVSMPGMMDTILNIGLNREVTQKLAELNPSRARFWWDCYRRLIQMFSEVVLEVPYEDFDRALTELRQEEGVESDAQISVKGLQALCTTYQQIVKRAGVEFPENPWSQVVLATEAVFKSWNSERAKTYRTLHHYSEDWGTAVTIQAMVFGNLNEHSGTGVVFTRDPSTGAKRIYGEYLLNAQGEDVVAGIRTPEPIEEMRRQLPQSFGELQKALTRLETHFNDAQDVEFTIEDKRLYILQTRSAKRTASAAIENVVQFVQEKRLKPAEALQRISFDQVRQLLHPTLSPSKEKPLGRGLAASPGAAAGRIAFDPERAVSLHRAGHKVILVRRETSPEDIMGMAVSEGILTSTGGMTSHAAVVGRGMGKCCVVGCSDLQVNEKDRSAILNGIALHEEDWITLNGSTGEVYSGQLPTQPVTWGESAKKFFVWADQSSRIPVYANADTPEQATQARGLGARGIGLCRTEHMFFDKDRIHRFRSMILSEKESDRETAARALQAYQEADFYEILKAMEGFPVTVRLLDPPLHEFLPSIENEQEIAELAKGLGTSSARLVQRIYQLHETNPMLGHRGCRLGITFPEIYEMQVRALAASLKRNLSEGRKVFLKIMIPLVMNAEELSWLLSRLKVVFQGDAKLQKVTSWGTMIELPRACLIANEIAPLVDFISFGTNDLTQTTLGLSRDDAAKFIPTYLELGLLKVDPFESIDQAGVGRLIQMAVTEGRKANRNLEVGICGEHGGDPESIQFFERHLFDSVSCSPYRVPIARLALGRCGLDSRGSKRRK